MKSISVFIILLIAVLYIIPSKETKITPKDLQSSNPQVMIKTKTIHHGDITPTPNNPFYKTINEPVPLDRRSLALEYIKTNNSIDYFYKYHLLFFKNAPMDSQVKMLEEIGADYYSLSPKERLKIILRFHQENTQDLASIIEDRFSLEELENLVEASNSGILQKVDEILLSNIEKSFLGPSELPSKGIKVKLSDIPTNRKAQINEMFESMLKHHETELSLKKKEILRRRFLMDTHKTLHELSNDDFKLLSKHFTRNDALRKRTTLVRDYFAQVLSW